MSVDTPSESNGTDDMRTCATLDIEALDPGGHLRRFLQQETGVADRTNYVHQDWPEKDTDLKRYLEKYEECGNISLACRRSGVSRATIYRKLKAKRFRDLHELAAKIAVENLEVEAQRRGEIGVLKPIYQAGDLVGYERVYSDSLLTLLLTGLAPEKYAKRIIQSENIGPPTQVTFVVPPPADPPDPSIEDDEGEAADA